jgi:hypothetical protein
LDSSFVPERRLLLAVLEEAVATFHRHVVARGRRGRRLFREAETWMLSDDVSWPCSFQNICDMLAFDAGYLRTGLQRWRDHRRAHAGLDFPRPSGFRRLGGSRTRAIGP